MNVSNVINNQLKKSLNNRKLKDPSIPLRYLEIGVHRGETITGVHESIDNVKVIKEGVDPYGPFGDGIIHRMTSQVFFALNEYFIKNTYDVIYIDAMHFSPIVTQEINESLKILNHYGTILLDDTLPYTEAQQGVTLKSLTNWQKLVSFPQFHNYSDDSDLNFKYYTDFPGYPHAKGDCWKSVAKIRMTRSDIKVVTIDGDSLQRPLTLMCLDHNSSQTLLPTIKDEDINWEYFCKNKDNILCFVSDENGLN
jgi:hypothetical protein|tara:strand:+ start:5938 stop:6693 length:756 start_codon:yes stop_codon:yes gene_type:complete